MPELDGFELASIIRSHPRFQRTAIILISSVMVEDVHRLKGYDSGAMDYVSVPIVPEILRAKVAIFADLYRKTEAARATEPGTGAARSRAHGRDRNISSRTRRMHAGNRKRRTN